MLEEKDTALAITTSSVCITGLVLEGCLQHTMYIAIRYHVISYHIQYDKRD